MTRKSSTPLFETANWIWPLFLGRAVNQYVEFRHRFDCTGKPDLQTRLHIAADTVYTVLVNGEFVDTGRFPDVPPLRHYDSIPVGPALQAGRNEVVIGLHVQGADSFQHLPGDPGLIFAVQGKGISACSGTGTYWRTNDNYRSGDIPRITGQLGFSFEYDASRASGKWNRVCKDDLFQHAEAIQLKPRPIPKVEVGGRLTVTVVAQGLLGPSLDDAASPSKGMQHDSMSAETLAALFGAGASPELPSEPGLKLADDAGRADGFYVIIDLGREEVGFADFDLETDEGVVIDIGHGEHLSDLRVRAFVGNRNFASRYVCRQGRQTFTHGYKRMAGRYLQLNVRGVRSGFKLHYAGLLPVMYPIDETGSFSASDRRMDDIFRTSVRTLRLCMHEHYEDCPWREQALYANDARNQALAGYYAFGVDKFPVASFELLGKGLQSDGWLEMCMPASIDITIPSFTMAWVLAVGDHWLYRADRAFVKRMMPVVKTILSARGHEMREGLLPCPSGSRYWQFYDWADGLEGAERMQAGEVRYDAVLNMLLCMALKSGAELADACGAADEASRWRALADTMREKMHRMFWDDTAAAYRTYVGDRASEHFCELVQAMAILSGTVRNAKAKSALCAKLVTKSDWVETTLSQSLYKYEVLLGAGADTQRAAVDSINAEWYAMLRKGATSFWETRLGAEDFDAAGSLCHGWSAIPAYLYGAYVLGVRPVASGYSTFCVNPVESELASACGDVATPHGIIKVEWHRAGRGYVGTVTHPASCQCVLPQNFKAVCTRIDKRGSKV